MKRIWVVMAAMLAVLSACGNDDDSTASDIVPEADSDATAGSTDGGSSEPGTAGGNEAGVSVGDVPPPGTATASVDGLDLIFDVPNAVSPCSIADDSITFGFGVDGEEFTLAAGANRVDGGWMGSIALDIANPDGETGPIAYYPAPGENGVLDESFRTRIRHRRASHREHTGRD